jgi:ribosome recycling factor
MSLDFSILQTSLEKIILYLESEFAALQLGRASTWLVESIDIFVPAWGMKQKLNQTANISILDAQTLKIDPWDKSTIWAIEKWIYDANIWLTPVNMWDHIMLKIPLLTMERRKDLTKLVTKMWEESKISCRNIRHDAMKDIKIAFDEKEISEDEKKNQEKQVDEIIKEYNTKIDQKVKHKSTEIVTI